MSRRKSRLRRTLSASVFFSLVFTASAPIVTGAQAQTVEDGSGAALGKDDTRAVLDLIGRRFEKSSAPKVTSLRRGKGSIVCGSVNVKNSDGLYLGERGFVADLSTGSLGRLPEGPEMLDAHADGYDEKERTRELYFEMCLD